MKKYSYFLILLLICTAMSMTSCSDKDSSTVDEEGYNSERLFMPMFRLSQNTNVNANVDPYGCGRASMFELSGSTHVNDMWLNWYEVDGASGYRLQARVGVGTWDNPNEIVLDTILPAGTHSFLHEDLAYGSGYCYAIQALSPKGEQYNSKWYGKGDSSHQKEMSRDDNVRPENYGALQTGERYEVPMVFILTNITEETVRVLFNIETAGIDPTVTYADFLEAAGKDINGNYLVLNEDHTEWAFDEIKIEPTGDNPDLPTFSRRLTAEEKAQGYVDFEGLTPNATYVVSGYKDGVKRYYDSNYNKLSLRMHGTKGEPIIIKANQPAQDGDSLLTQFNVPELKGKVTRLDTVLINYMGDNNIAEGQIFYLEGGQDYYMQSAIDMTKGFTLETNPDDIAAGKGRARIYMGVGYASSPSDPRCVNFNLSRAAKSAVENGMLFTIDDIIFRNINFGPLAYSTCADTGGSGKGTGNYFINMNSKGLGFSLNKLEISNCTMNGLVRGFIRFQGPNLQVIGSMKVDNCVFYDCGDYDSNGRGYAWFAGPGNQRLSNFFQNLTFTNNSIIDCPRHSLIGENGQLAWPASTHWNIVIENNTFVNISCKSDNKAHGLFIETSYPPSGSKFTVRKNLFVWVRKGDNDPRYLYNKGMLVTTPNVTYDFEDNYSTYIPSWTAKKGVYASSLDSEYQEGQTKMTDGMFTLRPWSSDSEGAGFSNGILNKGGLNELKPKFGDNHNGNEPDAVGYQLKAEELFNSPQPNDIGGTKNMHRHNVDGFYYNQTDRVKAHPIYTKKIGDQRWATGAAWK